LRKKVLSELHPDLAEIAATRLVAAFALMGKPGEEYGKLAKEIRSLNQIDKSFLA